MRFARALSLYVSSSCVRLAFVSPHAARITPHKSRFISIEAGDEADRYPSIYLFQRWRRRRGRNPSKIYWTGFNWLDVARFDTKSFHVESLDGGRNRNSRKLPRSWRKDGSIGRGRVFRLFVLTSFVNNVYMAANYRCVRISAEGGVRRSLPLVPPEITEWRCIK